MSNKIQVLALAAAIAVPGHQLASQGTNADVAATPCRRCDRPTPFQNTQGIAVTIMLRDDFSDRTVDAVIRDEPGSGNAPLIALKRGALSPALLYRALASLSQSRAKHDGQPVKRATTLLSAGSAFQEVPDEDREWIARLVTRLSGAPPTDIAGIGKLPSVTLTIDKPALRGK